MTREQFIATLEKELIRLSKADRDDILSDYRAHFAAGIEDGKTEDEVAAALGDPTELAKIYLENLPENAKGEPAKASDDAADDVSAAENTVAPTNAEGYYAPTYGEADTSRVPQGDAPAQGSVQANDDKTLAIVVVVLLSIFVAVPVAGSMISAWFSLLGFTITAFTAALALIAAGIAALTLSTLAGVGLIILSVAAAALGALMVVGLSAAVKGIVWLIEWYVGICKKMINGGVKA
ncbi:MAG: DUF1700 domain-containing protein [Clostridia bacterium]|nr:DUF1700 domain-containing protein [Clostridia bacterium]